MPPRSALLVALLGLWLPAAGCTAKPAPPTAGTPLFPPRLTRVRSADGVELAVEERGPRDAQTLVFVHGLAFSRDVWHRQLGGDLSRRYHLVAYDLRGHGRSSRPGDAVAYEEGARWADDLHAVLDATRPTCPVIVGWSLGGVVIANYLHRYGDSALGGVVFVDAVTKFSADLFAPDNGGYIGGLVSADDAERREATRRFARACFSTPLPDSEIESLLAAAGVLPASVHAAIQRVSLDGADQALRSLQRPALVIHGARDALVAAAMARHTAELVPGARLSFYESSGHAPFVDEPARFADDLAHFLDGVSRSSICDSGVP